MSLVNVVLNGRTYTVACDDGEEDHLRELGEFLNKRVCDLTESVGQVGDARLLLMAGLVIADELNESLAKVEECESELAMLRTQLESGGYSDSGDAEERVAEVLESAATRIEAIAAMVARA